ncbi:hypothetical protein B0T17DRAFT_21716 [Bombardia bombarda]|uniref:Uncharacterized protein n=1 Tax=Bombardia bombarda TaxID=252184 RepID=A0AA39XJ68_9PEZI|nr:hypothetical protein B0T17DRAFT_21716 [Bombardia bombarda]
MLLPPYFSFWLSRHTLSCNDGMHHRYHLSSHHQVRYSLVFPCSSFVFSFSFAFFSTERRYRLVMLFPPMSVSFFMFTSFCIWTLKDDNDNDNETKKTKTTQTSGLRLSSLRSLLLYNKYMGHDMIGSDTPMGGCSYLPLLSS